MFYISVSAATWLIWMILADKSRWRELFPICNFASTLALITDLIMNFFPFWQYTCIGVHPLFIHLADDLSVYPVVTYLFIQWLPKSRSIGWLLGYWLIWTSLVIGLEYIYVATGHMIHSENWTFWHSYLADWLLFGVFYKLHSVLGLKKLSQ